MSGIAGNNKMLLKNPIHYVTVLTNIQQNVNKRVLFTLRKKTKL